MYIINYYNTCSPVPVIFPATFLAPGMVSKMVSSGARESAQPMMAVWGAWPSSTSCWRAASLVLEPQGQPFTKRRLPSWRWDRWSFSVASVASSSTPLLWFAPCMFNHLSINPVCCGTPQIPIPTCPNCAGETTCTFSAVKNHQILPPNCLLRHSRHSPHISPCPSAASSPPPGPWVDRWWFGPAVPLAESTGSWRPPTDWSPMRPWPQGRTGWALWKRVNSWEFCEKEI